MIVLGARPHPDRNIPCPLAASRDTHRVLSMTQTPTTDTLDRLKAIVGPKGVIDDPHDMRAYTTEHRDRWVGATPLVVRPQNTDEVAAIVKVCAETQTAIVPQSGNTGLVGGQIPTGDEIVLSLNRMNAVRMIDVQNNTLTLEAGCILANVQQIAEEADRFFPLSLSSEGSAQIGGLISTNAGGNAVLRYGPMRDLVLGLEVVTPQGEIWNGLSGLRKDNTGYDLKQLFIGAEGTLGVITAATVKLFPRPTDIATAFVAVPSISAAIDLLQLAQKETGNQVSAFEIIPRIGLDFLMQHMTMRDPLTAPYDWYILMEVGTSQSQGQARAAIEHLIAHALEKAWVLDGTIAESEKQRGDLWALRESLSEVQKFEGLSLKHDVSVPISALPVFMARALTAVEDMVPGIRPVPFGHIGDGNIHFNLSQPTDMDRATFDAKHDSLAACVHDIVTDLKGSISAEHGIGVAKRGELTTRKSAVALDIMRSVKAALDPQGIMNPGKLL